MQNFIEPLLELEEYNQILAAVRSHARPVSFTGPSESQKAHLCMPFAAIAAGRVFLSRSMKCRQDDC